MTAGLRALLNQVIDYAGLFPPAELSLDEAVRNYARYQGEPESWMLGRFICPAARLRELEPYVDELFSHGKRLPIAALGRGGRTAEGFIAGFGRDVQAIVEFEQQFARRVEIKVFETRLPPDANVGFDFESHRLKLFLESSVGTDVDWRRSIPRAMDLVCNAAEDCGFKLRTGGVEASAFPPAEQIAFTLVTCRERDVSIKFTAGLHHPMRHFNASVNAMMHGFLNVFVAGVLAHTSKLDERGLVEILEEENPRHFTFDETHLRWKDHAASAEQISRVRRDRVISFGSCSFDEPRQDLRALGLL